MGTSLISHVCVPSITSRFSIDHLRTLGPCDLSRGARCQRSSGPTFQRSPKTNYSERMGRAVVEGRMVLVTGTILFTWNLKVTRPERALVLITPSLLTTTSESAADLGPQTNSPLPSFDNTPRLVQITFRYLTPGTRSVLYQW